MKELALICWVLLALDGSVHSELTNANFDKCKRFFYKGTAPTGYESQYPLDLAYICQVFQNSYRFASLYHKTKRIPIYSAYIMNPRSRPRPQGPNFKVEPQLVDKTLNKEMLTEDELKKDMTTRKIPSILFPDSQALNADYENSVYVKGHLNPVADQKYGPGKCSTCTLTNAVPMDATFNNGGWKSYEMKIRKKSNDPKCKTMYVLRGVIPGNNWISDSTGNRVNVPDQVWGAYCCVDKDGKAIESRGGIGKNSKDGKVSDIAITTLQAKLKQQNPITLFNNNSSGHFSSPDTFLVDGGSSVRLWEEDEPHAAIHLMMSSNCAEPTEAT